MAALVVFESGVAVQKTFKTLRTLDLEQEDDRGVSSDAVRYVTTRSVVHNGK